MIVQLTQNEMNKMMVALQTNDYTPLTKNELYKLIDYCEDYMPTNYQRVTTNAINEIKGRVH